MKILIISDYDSGCEFNVGSFDGKKFCVMNEKQKKIYTPLICDLLDYLIYEPYEDENTRIEPATKDFIENFNFILRCDNGNIELFKVDDIYNSNKGRIYDNTWERLLVDSSVGKKGNIK